MHRLEFSAMHCQMSAVLDVDTADAADALAQVPGWFTAWEQTLSRFRPTSELSMLNAQPGQWVPVSETLWAVVQAALQAAEISAGLVRPDLLPALENAGYGASFETLQPQAPRPAAPPATDWRAIQLAPATRAVYLPPGTRLDLGGIAKGWCADEAARRLRSIGPALVEAGGDIALNDLPHTYPAWPIGVALPGLDEADGLLLSVPAGGVATSGRDYRRWQDTTGQWHHHLIDPRTGQPAQTDVLTATVIGPTTQAAEIGAKVAVLLGSAAGVAWLTAHGMSGWLALENGGALATADFEQYTWAPLTPGTRVPPHDTISLDWTEWQVKP